jgi:FkbM family methyltransferase
MAEFGDADKVVLQRLKALGFAPICILDVGASNGGWTKVAATVFPDAVFHLFEPLAKVSPDYQVGLQSTLQSPIDCTLHTVALGETSGKSKIALDDTFFGSSLLVEQESDFFPSIIEISVMALDDMIQSREVPRPQFLKMDTQGYELAILKGAAAALDHIEVVLVEGWLTRDYGPQTPLLMEIAIWLATHDFFLFDFADAYRLESGVLEAV